MCLAVLMVPYTSGVYVISSNLKGPGDDSCTRNSHAVSVPGGRKSELRPSTKIIFHQDRARPSGISGVVVLGMVVTFLICVGAMHVLVVVGLLSYSVGGGWRGSLWLPRRWCTWKMKRSALIIVPMVSRRDP
jgi:hypothetical protein